MLSTPGRAAIDSNGAGADFPRAPVHKRGRVFLADDRHVGFVFVGAQLALNEDVVAGDRGPQAACRPGESDPTASS